jgi:hypothetical protein
MAIQFTDGKFHGFNDDGTPLVGGLLYTYVSGTTTPQATYTDSTLGTPNANPVVLDSRGEASVWLGTSAYTMKLLRADSTLVWSQDGVQDPGAAATSLQTNLAASSGSSLVGFKQTGSSAVARTVQSRLLETVSVFDYMTTTQINSVIAGDLTQDVVAAIQACILASVNMTTLADTATGPKFRVYFPAGTYNVSSGSIYVPTLAILGGAGSTTKLKTTGNNPIFVLGQNTSETNELVHRIEDMELYGNLTGANQSGLRIGLNGGYIYGNVLRNVYIRDMGGNGIYYASSNTSSMMLYTTWENVHVTNCQSYCVYIRVAAFNDALFKRCDFEEGLLGGFYVDYVGSATTNFSETIRFDTCSFEGNGQLIGGGSTYTVGSFGFKSVMIGGQYVFDNCYIENNAMQAGDTTGCAIYCQTPRMLSIRNSYLVGGNNLLYLYKGGVAEIVGTHIDPLTNNTALFTFDTPPQDAHESYLYIGLNDWYQQYISSSQFSRILNAATTRMVGFRNGRNNYQFHPPRMKNLVLRDSNDNAAGTGAIGYTAAKRLTNDADGTTTIGVNAVSSICTTAVYSLVFIADSNNTHCALLLFCPGGVVIVQQVSTDYTTTKDTAGKINVYLDGTAGKFMLQNKTASPLQYMAVRFMGVEVMQSADDYSHYEANYLQS